MSNPIGTIIKLLFASLIVGWKLKALNLDARDLLQFLGGFANTLMNIFTGFVGWAADLRSNRRAPAPITRQPWCSTSPPPTRSIPIPNPTSRGAYWRCSAPPIR